MFKKENLRKNFLRVKQTAEQKIGRSEKTEVLSDDLQTAEKRVELLKQVSSNTYKKLSSSLLVANTSASDADKRLKKMPEAGLGHGMVESASTLGTEFIIGQMYQMCGECQTLLAKNHLEYEQEIEKTVLEPIHDIIENEIPNIAKLKKALNKVTLDMDSAKNRWNSAVRQTQTPGVNMQAAAQKVDAIKDELDEANTRVDQAKDAYTTGLFSFISRESEHSQNLLSLLQAQAKYHQSALDMINAIIPRMQESLLCNPVKPVYGMALEEHLRCTNRDIAQVIEACVCYLLECGIEEEGLFRIAGMANKVKKLKASFDAGFDLDDTTDIDPHTVASALKQYLRELPEPLLTFQKFPEFMAAAQLPAEQRLQALWVAVDHLPKPNYDNFRYLVKFLSKLREKSDINKMTPGNIAIVIGPNLIWSEGDSGQNMMNTGILSLITELIVQHADWFFPGEVNFGGYSGENSPQLNKSSSSSEPQSLEKSTSNQSSTGSPFSSPPVNQEARVAMVTSSTLPPASRSPSVSPNTSSSHLSGAPLAESEDLQVPGSLQRRVTRKPAPPPPPERPHSVAVTASFKPLAAAYQTWPRQAATPIAEDEDNIEKGSEIEETRAEKPERPHPPDRVSSLPHGASHMHSDRPKIPPPLVPPSHKRSASTGAPVTIPGNGLQCTKFDSTSGSPYSSTALSGDHESPPVLTNSNNQLSVAQTVDSNNSVSSSLSTNKQITARSLRVLPPPPPPPEATIVEQTHL
ncbi:rho GTPase-activating protein 44-like isoform X4 [Dreissena polymorpha]|uniref:rho GTPase-activating protein 44-like isoform X4 n=1 Tax=Dreissena polymorpha TaxID=45954 RepID=UPI0022645969|nr:rho GTPase-activating protein 44-like isoform X4 [Dreissena polymorpha]